MNNAEEIIGKVHEALRRASRIYYGRDRACRCGCKGSYADRGGRTFTRYSNTLRKALETGDFRGPVEFEPDFANVPVGPESIDNCFCLYFCAQSRDRRPGESLFPHRI